MHPAYSVIAFSTASGAGYGLLIWLSVAAIVDAGTPRLAALILALALITFGLLASTFHLGRPERAWRAFSQWRTSWLSREGVAAIVTYVPAAALGLGWMFGEWVPAQIVTAAWADILCALVTVWCTGMIYASLLTIRAWHQPLVAPTYIVLALATGAVLAGLIFGNGARWIAAAAVATLACGAILKWRYWSAIDLEHRGRTVEAATGLGAIGKVRPLDPPHTQPNFVMREMGYQVARRHARRLRAVAMALLFALPIAAEFVLLLRLPVAAQVALSLLAVVSAAIGVLVERWLFFAEAEHVVVLYYRGGVA